MKETNDAPIKEPDEWTPIDSVAQRLEKVYSTAARLAKSAPGHEARAFEHAIQALTGIDPQTAKLMRPALLLESEESEASPKKKTASGSPRPSGPRGKASARIQPILEAEPQRFVKTAETLTSVITKHKVMGLLRLARDDFQVNELLVGELYHLVSKLRLGIPNNQVRDVLSKAEFAEIGFRDTDEGRFYSLNMQGDKALDAAIEKVAKTEKGRDEDS